MQKTALLVGATGLVGSHLLVQLLEDPKYKVVRSVSRRLSGVKHPKLEEVIIPLDELEKAKDKIVADQVFCCLGTTIGKAGSKVAFEKVDYEFPVKLAEISKSNNTSHFLIVTAMGANKNSMFFYNRVKGKVEETIGQIGFDHFTIIRPSLILGDRKEKRRMEGVGKAVMKALGFLMIGPLKNLRAVHAQDIARSMHNAAMMTDKKVRIIPSNEIG